MPDTTADLQGLLESISFEDENFIEELLGIAQLFRPFSEGMTAFLREHGYIGDPEDTQSRVAFVRAAFESAGMTAPREIREWFAGQPVKRETVFGICFRMT